MVRLYISKFLYGILVGKIIDWDTDDMDVTDQPAARLAGLHNDFSLGHVDFTRIIYLRKFCLILHRFPFCLEYFFEY